MSDFFIFERIEDRQIIHEVNVNGEELKMQYPVGQMKDELPAFRKISHDVIQRFINDKNGVPR